MPLLPDPADIAAEEALRVACKRWMTLHQDEAETATELAEMAAHEGPGEDEWLDDPDHWVWEIAIEVMPD